ncbi:MAG: Uma2 family endonuclease [Acidobacteriaceae bacterium]|nr:Uma2 family endonuclease [Acidobacteriaceae bacterium]MBV9294852.1 Uma2 family endonuclease [Acidobacteriaceae bacterium]MBV9765955.1 Uma2 family endonuclease [Acidobacteriaceae bacterium]
MATIATMTGEQFDALSYEEGRRWELLGGELIIVSSPTPEHQDIVFNLLAALKQYLRTRGGGRAHQDIEFALSEEDRLRPDVCVLLGDRADFDPGKVPIRHAPNIAAEVISPSERAGDTRRKTVIYLRAGVQEVWQIYPATREVLVYAGSVRRELQLSEDLTTDLLPGWRLAVSSLFA